jgi:2'-5' RNA ligase
MINPSLESSGYIDFNVAILPDKDLSSKLISWSKTLASNFETDYILNTINHFPHLSLYSARYPIKNKQAIEDAINKICHDLHPFSVTLKSLSLFSGFLFYDLEKDKKLIELHEKIVDELNPLREGLISDNQKQLVGLSSEQKNAIKKYGYVSVKNLYMPHISLTHLKDSTDQNAAKNILPKEINFFSVDTIVIAPFAKFGTLPKPLKIFSIEK